MVQLDELVRNKEYFHHSQVPISDVWKAGTTQLATLSGSTKISYVDRAGGNGNQTWLIFKISDGPHAGELIEIRQPSLKYLDPVPNA